MEVICILLLCALGAAIAWAWQREKAWQQRHQRLCSLLGLRGDPADIGRQAAEIQRQLKELGDEAGLRKQFEGLLNEIRQGVAVVDKNLRIRYANPAVGRLFDRPSIQRDQALLDAIQDHQVVDAVRQALAEGRRTVIQFRHLRGDSSGGCHYLAEASPLAFSATQGAWLMVHDITDQVQTEQIRKDFVANASHELRTPLTIIQGYIETLRDGLISDPESANHCLSVMDKHGQRLLRIIEDMLTISRLEAAEAHLNIEPFNLQSCVQDAIDQLSPMHKGRQVSFLLDFPANNGTLFGDRFYWNQIFANLLENAIKENPGRDLVVRVAASWEGELCTIRLSDNGVGIPTHDIPFVFKRFFRGHKHHGQAIKGTGLGLSIVRRAVEAHGGTISLRSTPGTETLFTIQVPARHPGKPFSGTQPAPADPPSAGDAEDTKEGMPAS